LLVSGKANRVSWVESVVQLTCVFNTLLFSRTSQPLLAEFAYQSCFFADIIANQTQPLYQAVRCSQYGMTSSIKQYNLKLKLLTPNQCLQELRVLKDG